VRDKNFLFWVILATFFLVLLNLPPAVSSSLRGFFRESLATYQGGVTRLMSGVQRTSSAVGNITEVIQERDRLDREAVGLRTRLRSLEPLIRENQELRMQLDYQRRVSLKTVACEVIARDDGYGWWQTIRLDKGRKHGLAANMPVITPDGVVGRTTEVSDQTCDVLLISDRSFKVSVRFDQEGSFGILHGGGVSLGGVHSTGVLCVPGLFRVDYLRKDMAIQAGERVMTSGLGGIFPSGLPVGRVVRMSLDETGLYQHGDVEPVADLGRLRSVLVVTGKQGVGQ
jgi:rod shape-determining protein MreC